MKPLASLVALGALACALTAAAAGKSPSEEFEEKMKPRRPPVFLLPSGEDGPQQGNQKSPQVQIMDIGQRRPQLGKSDSQLHRRASEEFGTNNPPTSFPQPQAPVCSGNPPICYR